MRTYDLAQAAALIGISVDQLRTRRKRGRIKAIPTLGGYLRILRDTKDFSQADLEKASGVDQNTISKIEIGDIRNPGISTVHALARALGSTVERFAIAADGKDPEKTPLPTDPELRQIVREFVARLPEDVKSHSPL